MVRSAVRLRVPSARMCGTPTTWTRARPGSMRNARRGSAHATELADTDGTVTRGRNHAYLLVPQGVPALGPFGPNTIRCRRASIAHAPRRAGGGKGEPSRLWPCTRPRRQGGAGSWVSQQRHRRAGCGTRAGSCRRPSPAGPTRRPGCPGQRVSGAIRARPEEPRRRSPGPCHRGLPSRGARVMGNRPRTLQANRRTSGAPLVDLGAHRSAPGIGRRRVGSLARGDRSRDRCLGSCACGASSHAGPGQKADGSPGDRDRHRGLDLAPRSARPRPA